MSEILRRLRYLVNRRRLDEELADDLEFHREMAVRAGGVPLGNALHLREEAREAWGWTWIDRFFQDLRYAARMLRRSPGFTVAAVLILGIGIGVNVAAFGFFNLMVLRPLPVRDPATLVRFQRRSPQNYASVVPYPEMAFFRANSRTLSAVLAWGPSSLTMEGEEKPVAAHFVTANFFSELGAVPQAGRLLDPVYDEAPSAQAVVVLSHGFWQRRFGSDPLVVGKALHLNGKPVIVAGVASATFSGLSLGSPDLWLPVTQQPYFISGSKLFTDVSVENSNQQMWGRLQPGVTPKAAENELRSLAAEFRKQHPNDIWENESIPGLAGAYITSAINRSHHGTGAPDSDKMVPVAALIGALVLLILAVACSNLGGLMLARGVAREREIAIRVSIGAGRGRLVRQLFTESLLLGLVGSVAGLGLGGVVLRALMLMTGTPAWLNPSPDWRVMCFAGGMGIAAAILFGLTPALQVARQRTRATVTRQILIGAQVAASCVLLIVAGLLVHALNQATSGDPGFAYQEVVSIDPSLGNHGYSPARAQAYLDALHDRLSGLPGVASVALASNPPLGNKTVSYGTEFNGRPVSIHTNHVEPRYFQTLRIPLLRGRNLTPGDSLAAVVSESLARVAWPGQEPLGRLLELGDSKYTVVGVAGNLRSTSPAEGAASEAYFLAGTADLPSMVMLVRTSGAPEAMVSILASNARTIDPKVPLEVELMKSALVRRLQGTQYSALSVGLLALVALLLACLGIVGLVSYAVSQRTKEIGIRMALGAAPSHILSVVLRQFSRPVVAGLVVGTGGAAALARVLRQVLLGVGNLDPAAYLGAIGLFAATVAVAAIFPARRALRVDPLRALRND